MDANVRIVCRGLAGGVSSMTPNPPQPNTEVEQLPPGQLWAARNWQRVRLTTGFLLSLVGVWGLVAGAYLGTLLNGSVGLWLLGGWPAMKRLFRHPRMQIKHWYFVLIDARQYHHKHFDNGKVEVVEMRPTLSNGWGWRSVRWYERE